MKRKSTNKDELRPEYDFKKLLKNGVRVVGLISDQKPNTVSTVAGDTKQTLPPPKTGGKH